MFGAAFVPPSSTTVTSIVESDDMKSNDIAAERGSGNVFADLGLPDADAHLVKAELVSRIDDLIRNRGITQTEAARLFGLSQSDMPRLLRGDFREHSVERLFRLRDLAFPPPWTAVTAVSPSSAQRCRPG